MRSSTLLFLASALVGLCSCRTTNHGSAQALPSPGSSQQTGDIGLSLSTSRSTYNDGDPILITVKPAEACHLRVFTQDAEGKLSQLWPNKVSPDRVVKTGETLELGSAKNGFILRAREPYGRELIWAIASTEPFPSGYQPDSNSSSNWGTSARGMATEVATFNTKRRGEAKRVVEILK